MLKRSEKKPYFSRKTKQNETENRNRKPKRNKLFNPWFTHILKKNMHQENQNECEFLTKLSITY
jgi:hypothetical protein